MADPDGSEDNGIDPGSDGRNYGLGFFAMGLIAFGLIIAATIAAAGVLYWTSSPGTDPGERVAPPARSTGSPDAHKAADSGK